MSILILDPEEAREVRHRHVSNGESSDSRFTEMWEGVEVVPPFANDEHQDIQLALCVPLFECIHSPGLGKVRAGVNVAERHENWSENYRGPDVVVYLTTTTVINYGSHWVGRPDFLVEIISPGESPRAKFGFYAAVKTREVLIVDRYPWALELFQLVEGQFVSAGRSDLHDPQVLRSKAVPFTLRLTPGNERPQIEVTHIETGKRWLA